MNKVTVGSVISIITALLYAIGGLMGEKNELVNALIMTNEVWQEHNKGCINDLANTRLLIYGRINRHWETKHGSVDPAITFGESKANGNIQVASVMSGASRQATKPNNH